MDPGGVPPNREEATIEVPSQGGGPPEESKEPQFPVGTNPELKDDDKGLVSNFYSLRQTVCSSRSLHVFSTWSMNEIITWCFYNKNRIIHVR